VAGANPPVDQRGPEENRWPSAFALPPVGLPSRLRRSGLPSGWNGFKSAFSKTTENYAHSQLQLFDF
jgi:hypothetical protein